MQWKPIPGFTAYEVSEHGDVRHGDKMLRPERVKGSGRKRFSLSKNGRKYPIFASRIVAFAFIGEEPFDSAEVCHRDGFHHNNHYTNLRWGTHASNVDEAAKHKAERQVMATLLPTRPQQLSTEAAQLLARASS